MEKVISRLYNSLFKSKKKGQRKGLNPINVKIVSPLALPYHNNSIVNKINVFLINKQLKNFIPKNKKIYVWSFSPIWENFINTIPNKFRIFHCVDALHTYDDSDNYKNLFYKSLKVKYYLRRVYYLQRN